MPTRTRAKIGRPALFSGRFGIKDRRPVSITLSPRHHQKLRRAMKRLDLTRADVIALLVELHADALTLPPSKKPDN